jgi:Bacteriodetes cell division protein (FtsL-like)
MDNEETIEEPQTQQEPEATGYKIDWKFFFTSKWVVKNIPFFFFLAFLAVLYIYNGHYADKIERKISESEKHIKELEYQYKTIKSEVIFRSKASELEKAVAPMGLKEQVSPPMRLDSINPQ